MEKAALAFLIHEAHVGAHLHALRTYLLGSETTVVRDFVRSLQVRSTDVHIYRANIMEGHKQTRLVTPPQLMKHLRACDTQALRVYIPV